MDRLEFDRLARLLGGAGTRRAGLKAALAVIAGATAGSVVDAEARSGGTGKGRGPDRERERERKRKRGGGANIEGPCGNGTRRANVCAKNSECCTGICNLKPARKNRDGKGRCRCIRKGGACTSDRNCCGDATCDNKVCTVRTPGPDPSGCGKVGETCTANADCCGGLICSNGICAVLPPCTVCATCTHTTVQGAINEATAGDTIYIDAGDWDEDLAIDKSLTLAPCSTDPVRLRNATTQERTITLPTTAPATSNDLLTLTIQDLTVTSTRDVQGGETGGGIYGYGNVVLNGTAMITGNKAPQTGDTYAKSGGGINLCAGSSLEPGCKLTLNGTAAISDNISDSYGGGVFIGPFGALELNDATAITGNVASYVGGVYIGARSSITMNGTSVVSGNDGDSYGGGVHIGGYGAMTMNGSSSVKDNTCGDDGGGVYLMDSYSTLTLNDDASITGNTSGGDGGGVTMYSYPHEIVMNGRSAITDNTGGESSSGGGIYMLETALLTMNDEAQISLNSVPGGNSKGGGVYTENLSAEFVAVIMSGNSRIATNSAHRGAGVYLNYASQVTMDGSSSISGNTSADQGGGVYMNCLANPNGTPANSKYTSVTLSGSATITGNTATEGGAIFGDLEYTATGFPGKVIGGAGITGNTPSTDQCEGTDKPTCV